MEKSIVSYPDSEIEFSTEDKWMEQTWRPDVKKIRGIRIPYSSLSSFSGVMEVSILSDDGTLYGSTQLPFDVTEGDMGEFYVEMDLSSLVLGNRYHMRLSYVEVSEPGQLVIPSGSNYEGCSIGGKETGEAAALSFMYEKSSRPVWMYTVFFPFFAMASFFAVWWDRRLEETLALAFVFGGSILCFAGVAGQLAMGIRFVFVAGFICLFAALILSGKKQVKLSSLITPGIVFYIALMCFFLVLGDGLYRKEADEYSHWGLAVKDMLYYDSLANHVDTVVVAKRYPPFLPVIQYFFTHINGTFSDRILYMAYLSVFFSMLLPVFKSISWKKPGKGIVAGILCMTIPMFFFGYIYTLYADLMLAGIFAFLLFCYYSEEMSLFNGVRIAGAMAALIWSKDVGLVLSGLAVLLMIADTIWKEKRTEKRNIVKNLIPYIVFLIVIGVCFLGWQYYCSQPPTVSPTVNLVMESSVASEIESITTAVQQSNIQGAVQASGLSVTGLWKLFTGQAPVYKYEVIKLFIRTLFISPTYKLGSWGMSYLGIGVTNLLIVFYVFRGKEKDEVRRKFFSFSILSFLVLIGYALFLMVMYLFAFSQQEALVLASHQRYLGSCIGGITFALWGFFIQEERLQKEIRLRLCLTALVCSLFFGLPLEKVIPAKATNYITEELLRDYEEIDEVARSFTDREESIYYVHNNAATAYFLAFKDRTAPMKNHGYNVEDIYSSEEMHEKEELITKAYVADGIVKTPEEWAKELESYDYVFLHYIANVFPESYAELFGGEEFVSDRTFYRVEKSEEGIRLVEVAGLRK